MTVSNEITIKVPIEVAEAYRNATEAEREQIQFKLYSFIETQLSNQRLEAIKQFRNTMDQASIEAQANGLTPELLTSILNDEE